MLTRGFLFIAIACASICAAQSPAPVLVELFTSEGCSSCPPADEFLRSLDAKQPVEGAQLIVLGEHVDYWDGDGWRDIYSDRNFTARQEEYVSRLGLETAYTPQIVIDGAAEASGNDRRRAIQAIEKARTEPKVLLRISSVTFENGNIRAHVEAGAVPDQAELVLALALDHAESQVLRGENRGRHLQHVAVARNVVTVGKIGKGETFAKDVEIKTNGKDASYRLLAFLQEPEHGKVLGAAVEKIGTGK